MNSLLLSVHPLLGMCALALLFLVSYLLVLGGRAVYRFFLPKTDEGAVERARISPTPKQVRKTTAEAAKRAEPAGKRPSAGALPSGNWSSTPKKSQNFTGKNDVLEIPARRFRLRRALFDQRSAAGSPSSMRTRLFPSSHSRSR